MLFQFCQFYAQFYGFFPILSILCLILWVLSFRLICGCTDAVLYGTASVHPQVPNPIFMTPSFMRDKGTPLLELPISSYEWTKRSWDPWTLTWESGATRVNLQSPIAPTLRANPYHKEMEMEIGHHSDAACGGGEKVSSGRLLVVAASKEWQQHDRITYSAMFIQILGWFLRTQ